MVLALVLMFILVMMSGCPGPARKPGQQEPDRPDVVPGPEELKQEEPVISLYDKDTGKTTRIKMEKYIQGVVAAEMDPTWPVEALAAQAILARTFTLKKIEEGGVKKRNADASTDEEEFQAYAPEKINDRVQRAVERTRGLVVTYKGKYINGWFHADGGGRTAASALEGLAYKKEPTPYIKSVKDPGFAITAPENKSWTVQFPLNMVRNIIREKIGQDPGVIRTARIIKKGPSGRAMTIRLGNATVSGPALRIALGKDKMRSTLIERLEIRGNNLVIHGRGYGHGVGMSQWGARALAEKGKNAQEIINYFFKGVEIKKVWK
ncbi:sporulation protein and related proteins [Calderihabitans maritimus]|uniref:Sporulation protein and related proteins n=2 Tax=Calderihabitans maritimus TaxID=1246530 RepID=A0A1Z5HSD6_9FIRM|nr:sporulation protein and related proteins [Calderihabitans maritimus]